MQSQFVNFPPIEKHGVIGDRRTAALVAADGTIDWWCLPDYDDDVICGALLDSATGGFCRFGPEHPLLGEQRYEQKSACLLTTWPNEHKKLELSDLMPWPERQRASGQEKARVLLRRVRAIKGEHRVRFDLYPRRTFSETPKVKRVDRGVRFGFAKHSIALWSSFAVDVGEHGATASFVLQENEEAWVMIGLNEDPSDWSSARCAELHEKTNAYWREWVGGLMHYPNDNAKVQRSAITVHLLAHAPNASVVAAVTTSLPERIGGDRNYDYRYTWVRDASLAAAFLAELGQTEDVGNYLGWLCDLDSEVEAPMQVCYRTDGQTKLAQRDVDGVSGYSGSEPVRFGNHAYKQRQLGSLGWFADAALIFLESGGAWQSEYWKMLRRAAEYICEAWQEEDSGVWELGIEAHYVASKVMAWVLLDRALRVAQKTGEDASEEWKTTKSAIHEEVLTKGWSEKQRSFRQRYDAEALDAGSLLIPLMGFLPPDDPRVLGTLDAIERELVIEGLVHRFDPTATLGGDQLPMGEFEGAFLPATFWYAHVLADAGRTKQAAETLGRCEEIAAGPGLFAEEADARRKTFLGNTPLLFSQVEYGRALIALHKSEPKNV